MLPSTTSVSTKGTTLHAFFNGASTPGPALFVPGAHRSSCVSKPSKQFLNVNNAEPQAKSSEHARIACKNPVQSESSDSEDEPSTSCTSDVGGDTDVEIEDSVMESSISTSVSPSVLSSDKVSVTSEDTYTLTKAMGDQDCKVSALYPNYPCLVPRAYLLSRLYVLG